MQIIGYIILIGLCALTIYLGVTLVRDLKHKIRRKSKKGD